MFIDSVHFALKLIALWKMARKSGEVRLLNFECLRVNSCHPTGFVSCGIRTMMGKFESHYAC
jgi:hypothetical protein